MPDPLAHYSHQQVTEEDIAAVERVMRSDFLTQGPEVEAFEHELAAYLGAKHVIAVSSGTAALHLALLAVQALASWPRMVRIPTITFVATANAVLLSGRDIRFLDVDADTLLAPGADLTVDLFGQPARDGGGGIVDAAHSLGAIRDWSRGIYTLSFHPQKTITTGEGGAIVADNDMVAKHCRLLRSHGRNADGEMVALGFNYRLSEIAAALGRSQLQRIDRVIAMRRTLARAYTKMLMPLITGGHLALPRIDMERSAWHLFPVLLRGHAVRERMRAALAERGIASQIHYPPVHLQPYYRQHCTYYYKGGDFPVAENASRRILSLPLHLGMNEQDVMRVVRVLESVLG